MVKTKANTPKVETNNKPKAKGTVSNGGVPNQAAPMHRNQTMFKGKRIRTPEERKIAN